MQLTDFDVLTFDCYGTLIDWESGIYNELQPWLARNGLNIGRDEMLETFGQHEAEQETATPAMLYSDLLAEVHQKLARHWGLPPNAGDAAQFGASVGNWPAFADSPAALQYLKQHYKLVILSNVDRVSFARSNQKLGVEFEAIYTAQDIGSYKPNPTNFEYMLTQLAALGIEKSQILHVAQSLFHDHVPAQRAGLATCWIDRRHAQAGWGATVAPAAEVTTDFRANSLAELVEQHKKSAQKPG
jgi:2-haloalkanoic acid dehalogenase type II